MKQCFFLCVLLVVAACSRSSSPQSVLDSTFKQFPQARYDCIDWKGTSRCYYIVPPVGAPSKLIMALHPAFTSVKFTENVSGLAAHAVPKGYLVVFPEGIDKQWNDGRVMTEVQTYNLKTDDVGFINEVTARVQKQYGLRAADTLVAGMSNGGMMSQRLACQSEHYGMVATVVANLPKGLRKQCSGAPKPLLMVFGTADKVVEYTGGVLADSGKPDTWGEVESAADTEAFFVKHNGCSRTRVAVSTLADASIDDTIATVRDYQGCTGARLRTITVQNMGHTWPGESSRFVAWITTRGAVSKQFNATVAIADFLQNPQTGKTQ